MKFTLTVKLKPRNQHNPAGIHLISAGRCPNKRRQLSIADRRELDGLAVNLRRLCVIASQTRLEFWDNLLFHIPSP